MPPFPAWRDGLQRLTNAGLGHASEAADLRALLAGVAGETGDGIEAVESPPPSGAARRSHRS
jgi:hypothetical protein